MVKERQVKIANCTADLAFFTLFNQSQAAYSDVLGYTTPLNQPQQRTR
jgi:hypothetical protein